MSEMTTASGSSRPLNVARATGYLFLPRSWRRSSVLTWLRRTHAWLGVWGAIMGLLFGATGILLNHRAVLKIPAGHVEESTVQIAVAAGRLQKPHDLGLWLQAQVPDINKPARSKVDDARTVIWGGQTVQQPQRWTSSLSSPDVSVQAEYWMGNSMVTLRRSEHDLVSMFKQMHKGSGLNTAWILLVDTLGGALIVLSLTGILLWSRLHGTRLAALGIGLGSSSLMVLFAALSMH